MKLNCGLSAPSKRPGAHVLPNPPTRPNSPGLAGPLRGGAEAEHSRFFLTAWETDFVADLIARGTRWPSPKQAVVILRILEKADAFGAASAAADWEDVP